MSTPLSTTQAAVPALFADMPVLSGSVHFDTASLQQASTDFGQIVHTRPIAVVKPASVGDITGMVKFAAQKGLKVIPRGMSHSAFGQGQCDGGIVFDMCQFNAVLGADFDCAQPWIEVQAGATWDKLIKFSAAQGYAPPATTDWQKLTVGGTLSTGGVGFMSHMYGLQTDNVIELDVVDGEGMVHTCSPHQNEDLFNAVRAGLGQYGIITRARLALTHMPKKMHVFQFYFSSLDTFCSAMESVTAAAHFECVHAFVVPNEQAAIRTRLSSAKQLDAAQIDSYCTSLGKQDQTWLYFVELVKYDDVAEAESRARILAMQPFAGTVFSSVEPYYEYVTKEPPLIAVEKQKGKTPHPELALMQPAATLEPFLRTTLSDLRPEDMGEGPILIIPVLGKSVCTPMFVRPETELFYFVGILRNAFPATPERVAHLTEQNIALYAQSVELGGNRYPCDSMPEPSDPASWCRHYGSERWQSAQDTKLKYDPRKLFMSNLNIFGR